jgi:hypothetical protein
MDHNFDIDIQQLSVEDRNKFILDHFIHTWRGRISDDTLYQHVLNIQYFIDSYLSYCVVGVHDEPRSVDQVSGYDVYDFITDWLPRKGLVVSARRVKSYLASFNKLYKLMGEHSYIPAKQVEEILDTIKWDRQVMIETVVHYDDEPDESDSTEAFLAGLKELEARWKALHNKSDN